MTPIEQEADLRVSSLFADAWRTFKRHWSAAIAAFVIFVVIGSLGSLIQSRGVDAIVFIISGPLYAGAYKYYVDLLRGRDPGLARLFDGFRSGRLFVRAFAVYFLYTLMVLIGLILLVIPGIYIAIAFLPAMFLVLDEERPILATLNRAWDLTEGHRGEIFVVTLALLLLFIVGLLALGIGLLLTGPLVMLMGAALYDRLLGAYRETPDPATVSL